MTTLPDKPSELLLLALKDLAAVEAMPKDRYQVNMNAWVLRPAQAGPCYVCFAGAVMIGTLGASVLFEIDGEARLSPSSFQDYSKLMGLNAARTGQWRTFLDYFYNRHAGQRWWWSTIFQLDGLKPTPYEQSPAKFRRDMKKAAAILKKNGL